MSDVLKGVNLIWNRLFDHRSFLQGEQQFFLREFELKRNEQEVTQLFEIVENVADLKDTQIHKIKHSINNIFPQLQIDLNQSLHICKCVDDLETKYKEDLSLEILRDNRKSEWEQFIDDMTVNCAKVDNTYKEKQEDLEDFYKDLEKLK